MIEELGWKALIAISVALFVAGLGQSVLAGTEHFLSGLRASVSRGRQSGRTDWLVLLADQFSDALRGYAQPSPAFIAQLSLVGLLFRDESHFLVWRILRGLMAFTLLILPAVVLLGFSTGLMLSLGLGGIVMAGAKGMLRRKVAREVQRARQELPGFFEAMAVCLEAGQSFPMAFQRVASARQEMNEGSWSRIVLLCAERYGRGGDREAILLKLFETVPLQSVGQFCSLAKLSEKTGASVAGVLRGMAQRARDEYQISLERKALEAPVKLLAPLIFCIFPCTFIVLLAPLAQRLQHVL